MRGGEYNPDGMLTSSFLSTLVKVLLVGAVMAGGAIGFYYVVENRPSNDQHAQVAAPSPAASADTSVGPTSPTAGTSPTVAPTASAASTPTPAAGLTDTGYKALDGSPLYAECMQPGLPLPPTYPTPSGPPATPVVPSPYPSGALNERTPPSAGEMPSFDLRTVQPAVRSGWSAIESKCYGYSMEIPPGWTGARELPIGYQQGETTTAGVNGQVSLHLQYVYSDADLLTPEERSQGTFDVYLFDPPLRTAFDAHDAVEQYVFDAFPLEGSKASAVELKYTVRVSAHWWASIIATLYEPYDPQQAAELRAVLDSMVLP